MRKFAVRQAAGGVSLVFACDQLISQSGLHGLHILIVTRADQRLEVESIFMSRPKKINHMPTVFPGYEL